MSLFKKKVTSNDLAEGFFLLIKDILSETALKEILSNEQKALLALACFSKVTGRYNINKDVMGYLVSIFISEFRATTDRMEFATKMLVVFDEINKINSFFGVNVEKEEGGEWLNKQIKQETPFGKSLGLTERLLVLNFYVTELKVVDEFIGSFLKNFKIVNT